MKLKLENDFDKGIATAVVIFGYIFIIGYYPTDWRIIWWTVILIGLIKTIWTKK